MAQAFVQHDLLVTFFFLFSFCYINLRCLLCYSLVHTHTHLKYLLHCLWTLWSCDSTKTTTLFSCLLYISNNRFPPPINLIIAFKTNQPFYLLNGSINWVGIKYNTQVIPKFIIYTFYGSAFFFWFISLPSGICWGDRRAVVVIVTIFKTTV